VNLEDNIMIGRTRRGWRHSDALAKPNGTDADEEGEGKPEERAVACADLQDTPNTLETVRFGALFDQEGGVERYLKVR